MSHVSRLSVKPSYRGLNLGDEKVVFTKNVVHNGDKSEREEELEN